MTDNYAQHLSQANAEVKKIIRRYILSLELDLDKVGKFTDEQMEGIAPAISREGLKSFLVKYGPIEFNFWKQEGREFPCNLFIDQFWSLDPDLFTALLYKIMEVDKAFLQIAALFFPSLPRKLLSTFEAFLPFSQIQDVMNVVPNSRYMICSYASNVSTARLVKARIETLELIIKWAHQNYKEIDPPQIKKSFLIGDAPIEEVDVVLCTRDNGQAIIQFYAYGKATLELTPDEAGLGHKRSKKKPLKAWSTLKKLASANGVPLKLDKQDVSNLNQKLKKIFGAKFRPIVHLGKGHYKTSFNCRIVRS